MEAADLQSHSVCHTSEIDESYFDSEVEHIQNLQVPVRFVPKLCCLCVLCFSYLDVLQQEEQESLASASQPVTSDTGEKRTIATGDVAIPTV